MAFDFSVSTRVAEWPDAVRALVDDVVIGLEQEVFARGVDDVRRTSRAEDSGDHIVGHTRTIDTAMVGGT